MPIPIKRFNGSWVRLAPDNAFKVTAPRICDLCQDLCRPGTLMRRRGPGYVHAQAGACRAQLRVLAGMGAHR